MKIQGTRGSITFDYENGYAVTASGELCLNHTFWVNKQSIVYWDPPHERERVTEQQLAKLIEDVTEANKTSYGQVLFG